MKSSQQLYIKERWNVMKNSNKNLRIICANIGTLLLNFQDELTSPENSGRYFLHHDDRYDSFFTCLEDNVRQYLRVLNIQMKIN